MFYTTKKQICKITLVFIMLVSVLVPVSSISALTPDNFGSGDVTSILSEEPVVVQRSRGSCEELARLGFHYANCPGGNGNPRQGAVVHLTPRQWECVMSAYGGIVSFTVSPSPGKVFSGVWDTLQRCWGL